MAQQTPFDTLFANDVPFHFERKANANAHLVAASQPLRNAWSTGVGAGTAASSEAWSAWGQKSPDASPALARMEDYAKRAPSMPVSGQENLTSYLSANVASKNSAPGLQYVSAAQGAPRQAVNGIPGSLRPQNVTGMSAVDKGISAAWAAPNGLARGGSQPVSRSGTPGATVGSYGEGDIAAVAAAQAASQMVSLRQRQDARGSQGFPAEIGQPAQLGQQYAQMQNSIPRSSSGLLPNSNGYAGGNVNGLSSDSIDVQLLQHLQSLSLKNDQQFNTASRMGQFTNQSVQESLLALLQRQQSAPPANQHVQGIGLQNLATRQAVNAAVINAALSSARNNQTASNLGLSANNLAVAQQLAAMQQAAARAAQPAQRQAAAYGFNVNGMTNTKFNESFAQQVALVAEANKIAQANKSRAAMGGGLGVNLQALQAAALLSNQRAQARPAPRPAMRTASGYTSLQHSNLANDQTARTVLLELGQTLAQLNVTVESAVNAGLLGGLGAADVKVVNDAHAAEQNKIRMQAQLERLQQAQHIQQAQQLQNAQLQQLQNAQQAQQLQAQQLQQVQLHQAHMQQVLNMPPRTPDLNPGRPTGSMFANGHDMNALRDMQASMSKPPTPPPTSYGPSTSYGPFTSAALPPYLQESFQLGTGLGDMKKELPHSEGMAATQNRSAAFSLFDSSSQADDLNDRAAEDDELAKLVDFTGLFPVESHETEVEVEKPVNNVKQDVPETQSSIPESGFDARVYDFFGGIEADEDDVLEVEKPDNDSELQQPLDEEPGANGYLGGDVSVEVVGHIDARSSEHRVQLTLA